MTDDNIARIGSIEAAIHDETRRIARARSVPQPPPAMQTTQDILNHILQTETDLRAKLEETEQDLDRLTRQYSELERQLSHECAQRQHFEAMIRRIAELVVNGARNGPPEAA